MHVVERDKNSQRTAVNDLKRSDVIKLIQIHQSIHS